MNPIDLVVEILSEEMDVPVSTEVPNDRPARFIAVSLEGDASDALILRPRIALTCWGATDRDAHGIAVTAIDALREVALDHEYLSSVDLETMSREEWSRTGQSRYLVLLELTINID